MYSQIYSKEEYRLGVVSQLATMRSKDNVRFDIILKALKAVLNFPIMFISIVDKDIVWFKSMIGLDIVEIPRHYSFCTHTIKRTDNLVIPDTLNSENFSNHPLVHSSPNIRFYAGIPIIVENQAVGTISILDYQPRNFLLNELELLHHFSHWAKTELEYQLKILNMPNCASCSIIDISEENKEKYTDITTNIWSRVACYQILKRKFRRFLIQPKSERKAISLILCDIDNFNTISNQYDYKIIDEILKYISSNLNNIIRINDSIGRYSNSEFAIIMQDCDLEESIKICERIRKFLEYQPISTSQGNILLTMSLGIVTLSKNYNIKHTEGYEELLFKHAEQALHSARIKGFNRFEVIYLE